MNPVSIIILLLIIAYCAFVIYKQVQKKKQGGCGGNCAGCSGCSGCSSFQVNDSSVKKKEGNQQWEIQQVLCFMHLQSLLDYILSE